MSDGGHVEQLLFGWSLKGLSGLNDYQPVAASPGLRTVSSALVREVIKVCRYQAPRGVAPENAPVAFGWVDRGDHRIAFRRSAVGVDGRGRPGNFCAHALVGPPEALPAVDVLASWGSPHWVARPLIEKLSETESHLPAASLASFVADAPALTVDPTAVEDLLTALLTANPRQAVAARVDPDVLVASMMEVVHLAPSLLEAGGFSTYEQGAQARTLTVVGMPPGVPRPTGALEISAAGTAPAARELAGKLVDARAPGHHLARVAVDVGAVTRAGESAARPDPREVVRLHTALRDLAAREDFDSPTVRRIAGHRRALDLFCATSFGRRAVAALLVDGDSALWSAIGDPALPDRVLMVLADALADRVVARADVAVTARLLDQTAGHRPVLARSFPAALADRVASSTASMAPADIIDAPAAHRLLEILARRGAPAPGALVALAATRPRLLLQHGGLPRDWSAAVLARALTARAADRREVAEVLLADRALPELVARATSSPAWADLVISGTRRPTDTAALVGAVAPDDAPTLVSAVLAARRSEDRAALVVLCVPLERLVGAPGPGPWRDIVAGAADDTLRAQVDSLASSLSPPPGLRELLAALDFPGAWGRALAAAGAGPAEAETPTHVAALGVLEQEAALADLFRRASESSTAAEVTTRTAVHLRGRPDVSWEAILLRAAWRDRQATGTRSAAPEVALGAVIDAVATGRARLARSRLADPLAQRLAGDLAQGAGVATRRLDRRAADAGGPAARWWSDLVDQRRTSTRRGALSAVSRRRP